MSIIGMSIHNNIANDKENHSKAKLWFDELNKNILLKSKSKFEIVQPFNYDDEEYYNIEECINNYSQNGFIDINFTENSKENFIKMKFDSNILDIINNDMKNISNISYIFEDGNPYPININDNIYFEGFDFLFMIYIETNIVDSVLIRNISDIIHKNINNYLGNNYDNYWIKGKKGWWIPSFKEYMNLDHPYYTTDNFRNFYKPISFFIGSDGYMTIGEQVVCNNKMYFDDSESSHIKIICSENENNLGVILKGWNFYNNEWCYSDDITGCLYTGKKLISGEEYYLKDGRIVGFNSNDFILNNNGDLVRK